MTITGKIILKTFFLTKNPQKISLNINKYNLLKLTSLFPHHYLIIINLTEKRRPTQTHSKNIKKKFLLRKEKEKYKLAS